MNILRRKQESPKFKSVHEDLRKKRKEIEEKALYFLFQFNISITISLEFHSFNVDFRKKWQHEYFYLTHLTVLKHFFIHWKKPRIN